MMMMIGGVWHAMAGIAALEAYSGK